MTINELDRAIKDIFDWDFLLSYGEDSPKVIQVRDMIEKLKKLVTENYQPKTTSTDIEVNDYIGLTDFMRGNLDKYTQDILDETERLDIWNTKSQLGKARKYIFNLLAKVFERGVDSGIEAYKTLMTDGLSKDDTITVGNIKSDTMNAKSWAMNWCAMCNKPSNKLSEDSICPQCL